MKKQQNKIYKTIQAMILCGAFCAILMISATTVVHASNHQVGGANGNAAPIGGADGNAQPIGGANGNAAPIGGANGNAQGQDTISTSIVNPLGSGTTSIEDLILKIIDVLLVFLIPLIVLYIMYAGFLYVTAGGNESKVTAAHNALLWAIVGGVIIIGAKLIIEIIQGTLTSLL